MLIYALDVIAFNDDMKKDVNGQIAQKFDTIILTGNCTYLIQFDCVSAIAFDCNSVSVDYDGPDQLS